MTEQCLLSACALNLKRLVKCLNELLFYFDILLFYSFDKNQTDFLFSYPVFVNSAILDIPNGRQKFIIINESGLYSLILPSRLPGAKAFKRWITSQVLPTIRKTGGYVSNEELFTETYLPFADDSVKELFRLNLIVIRQLNEKVEYDKLLVDFANHVTVSKNTIDMNTMAKLAEKEIENLTIGRNRLFKWLREKGVLMNNNLPYQQYIDAGYFEVTESAKETPNGTMLFHQTKVTGKGQLYLIRWLRAEYTG